MSSSLPSKSTLATLKAAESLTDLASLLGFKPKAVSYVLYKEPYTARYKTFDLPKRRGGKRTIKAPIESLKLLQRRLSVVLQNCIDELSRARNRKDRIAHGFKRRRSIITNAAQHRHRRWVFNVDLEEFFPSINFGRVRGFFIKNRDFALHENVATVIAQIACHDHSLPQGSPCSPVISNLITHLLDVRLVRLATEAGCTYSRYADDLTFSTNKREVPAAIAVPSGTGTSDRHAWFPGKPLRRVIERTGFRINEAKTHLMYRGSRQVVTGLVVNEKKVGVRSEYRNNVRAMVHRLAKTGEFEILGIREQDGQPMPGMRPGTPRELHGMLGFIHSIDVHNRPPGYAAPPKDLPSRDKTYRTFLMYSLFYAAPSPVVVCEGPTDNIYLTHAIRSLVAEYPDLAERTPKGKVRLKVRLYKYPRSSTKELLGLRSGGFGNLCNFIGDYGEATRRFGGPPPKNPIVVLYDNDSAAEPVRAKIKKAFGVIATDADRFVRVVANMYAMHVPGANPFAIEDCFDAATRAIAFEGKTFKDGRDVDNDQHFDKVVFAHKVIRPNADSINFAGFRPLLTSLVAAIQDHAASLAAHSVAPVPAKATPANAAPANAAPANAAPVNAAPVNAAPVNAAPEGGAPDAVGSTAPPKPEAKPKHKKR